MSSVYHDVEHSLGGSDHKPKKEIEHIKSYKSKTHGDTIHEHHHTHPEHHPMEKHTTRGDDEMSEHMMDNLGTPNPGEAQADAGDAGSPASPAGAAPAGAAGPTPTGAPPAAM